MLEVIINEIKSISNKSTLLFDCSFSLQKNNLYSIIGKNGCGKTTLLFAITRMLNQNNFEINCSVKLDNLDLYKMNDVALYKFRSDNFRFVFQDSVSALDPLKKLIFYFKMLNVTEEVIDEELNYFQLPKLSKIKKLYPYELSIGMLQRVNIILALLAEPKILLLDEPTSALDLPIMNLLNNRLKEYSKIDDRIVLIVTQDNEFAKYSSDYIAKFESGKLSEFFKTDDYFIN